VAGNRVSVGVGLLLLLSLPLLPPQAVKDNNITMLINFIILKYFIGLFPHSRLFCRARIYGEVIGENDTGSVPSVTRHRKMVEMYGHHKLT